jgi:RNA polymerase sigma factor (sigma-70 family)
MLKTISEDEFQAAFQEHQTYVNSLTGSFANALSAEARRACGALAVWEALRAFKPEFGQSFKSSLWRHVQWQCLRAMRDQRHVHSSIEGDIEGSSACTQTTLMLNDYLSILPDRDRRMVEARYIEECTYAEIAKREGYSKQGVRGIVTRSMSALAEFANPT